MSREIRYALRTLVRTPGFTLAAIVTLGLGIGANTAVFSLLEAVLLRPLPYAEPERLVMIDETSPGDSGGHVGVSYPNFLDWREQARSFDALGAYTRMSFVLSGGGAAPQRVDGCYVTAALPSTLRVTPELGRGFSRPEAGAGDPHEALISHRLWQRRFGSDTGVIGGTLTLDGSAYLIAGVMPDGFGFPTSDADVWVDIAPFKADLPGRSAHIMDVVARLAPGATIEQARQEMAAIARGIQERNPGADPLHGAEVQDARERIVGRVRPALLASLGAVAAVLLIACANVAGLLLARAASRRKETALRIALGATRGALLRQGLAESLILALAGGTAGALFAAWSLDAIAAQLDAFVPRARDLRLDAMVLLFTGAVSAVTGLVFGLVPVLRASGRDLEEALRSGGGSGSASPMRQRARSVLTVAEIAASLVLLMAAGLMLRSLIHVMNTAPGFRTENLLTLSVSLPQPKYEKRVQVIDFYASLPERLGSLPGVESVSAVSSLPVSGGDSHGGVTIEGRVLPPGESPAASYRRVLPGYFRAMGVPILQGRDFDRRDRGQGEMVVIISESMVRRFWPEESPLGRRIKIGPAEREPWLTIVGVAGDVRNVGLDAEPGLATYEPHAQRPWSEMKVVVRASGDPGPLAATVRAEILSIDPEILVDDPGTMRERISGSVAPRRIAAILLGSFALLALLISAVGLYSVISFGVTQRTREIGVRVAMGARRADVRRLVMGQALKLALVGVLLGAASSFALLRVLDRFLYDIGSDDPGTLFFVSLLLTAVVLLASWLPAQRAARVDPIAALRTE